MRVVLENLDRVAVLLEDMSQTITTGVHVVEVSLPGLHPDRTLVYLGHVMLSWLWARRHGHWCFLPNLI
jgi:hypothetical protein